MLGFPDADVRDSINLRASVSSMLGKDVGRVSWIGASLILATFSTTSSNVMYPSCYGTLGYVLGPLLMVVVQGLGLLTSLRAIDAALEHNCATFGDLGEALGGAWGRRLLHSVLWRRTG